MGCGCSNEPRHKVILREITLDAEHTYSYHFAYDGSFTWKEGDSSKLFLDVNNEKMGKKFSHASLTHEGTIRFTTRVRPERSDYKESMSRLVCGDIVEISKPKGDFGLTRDRRPVVLLSNGVGIAAVRSLIKSFEQDMTGVPFILQINVDRHEPLYSKEFDRLQQDRDNFKSLYVTNRNLYTGVLDHELQHIMEAFVREPIFHVVGSETFVVETIRHLHLVGFENEAIITDGLSVSGGCGCSSGGGCGCGGNRLTTLEIGA